MKFIIDIEPIKGTDLYRAKGFNTLVFDSVGLNRLMPYEEDVEFEIGDILKTENGTVEYRFEGVSTNGKLNVVNLNNGVYTTLSKEKAVLSKKIEKIPFADFAF